MHRRDRQLADGESGCAEEHQLPRRAGDRSGRERADQRAGAERRRQESKRARPGVQRLLRKDRQQDVEVEAEAGEDDHHPEDDEHAARATRVAEALSDPTQHRRPIAAVEREELRDAHQQ